MTANTYAVNLLPGFPANLGGTSGDETKLSNLLRLNREKRKEILANANVKKFFKEYAGGKSAQNIVTYYREPGIRHSHWNLVCRLAKEKNLSHIRMGFKPPSLELAILLEFFPDFDSFPLDSSATSSWDLPETMVPSATLTNLEKRLLSLWHVIKEKLSCVLPDDKEGIDRLSLVTFAFASIFNEPEFIRDAICLQPSLSETLGHLLSPVTTTDKAIEEEDPLPPEEATRDPWQVELDRLAGLLSRAQDTGPDSDLAQSMEEVIIRLKDLAYHYGEETLRQRFDTELSALELSLEDYEASPNILAGWHKAWEEGKDRHHALTTALVKMTGEIRILREEHDRVQAEAKKTEMNLAMIEQEVSTTQDRTTKAKLRRDAADQEEALGHLEVEFTRIQEELIRKSTWDVALLEETTPASPGDASQPGEQVPMTMEDELVFSPPASSQDAAEPPDLEIAEPANLGLQDLSLAETGGHMVIGVAASSSPPPETVEPTFPEITELAGAESRDLSLPEPGVQGENDISLQPPAEPKNQCIGSLHISPASEMPRLLDRYAWQSVRSERFGLAYHLSRAAGDSGDRPSGLPTPLAYALATLPLLDGSCLLDDTLQMRTAVLWAGLEDPNIPHPVRLITLLAGMSFALFAPNTDAGGLLVAGQSLLANSMPSLQTLVQNVVDLHSRKIAITAGDLRWLSDSTNFNAELDDHVAQCQDWLEKQRTSTLNFARATIVWHRLLAPGEHIGYVLETVTQNKRERVVDVGKQIGRMAQELEAWIDQKDRAMHPSANSNPLTGNAKNTLRERGVEALRLAEKWVSLVNRGQGTDDFRKNAIRAFSHNLRHNLDKACGEIRSCDSKDSIPTAEIGVLLLQRLGKVMAGEITITTLSVEMADNAIDRALNRELLAIPEVRIGPDYRLTSVVPEDSLVAACQMSEDWALWIRQHLARDDTIGARLALAELDGEDVDRDELEKELEKKEQDLIIRLELERVGLFPRLAEAAANGRLGENQRLEMEGELALCLPVPGSDLLRVREKLDWVRQRLDEESLKARNYAQSQLDGLSAEPQDTDRIRRLIEEGEIEVAHDYIERLHHGDPLPTGTTPIDQEPNAFEKFFPGFIHALLKRVPQGFPLVSAVDDTEKLLGQAPNLPQPFDQMNADPSRRQDALDLIRAWRRVAARRGNSEEVTRWIQDLFQLLKFPDASLLIDKTPVRTADSHSYLLTCRPLADRNTVTIPEVGSRAQGRYRIITVWPQGSGIQTLFRAVGELVNPAEPVIILVFNLLTQDLRLELAKSALNEGGARGRALVVDASLLLFLAQYPGDRLKALFDCTLPFTAMTPYVTDGGLVPREMFFGRQREMDALLGIEGEVSHLVYGGRQLGKTAMLRRITTINQDSPDPDRVVIYMEIRNIGLSADLHPRVLFRELAQELKTRSVLDVVYSSGAEFIAGVRRWLDKKPDRRILLLLDEADAFLREDAREEYRVIVELKKLMESTHRRFKVVLAGLHNVRRFHRGANAPFEHLGTPVRIGPMIRGEDLREAQRLVRLPLQALGFVFPEQDAVSRILAHCNYYPNLIQLFCKRLLTAVRDRWRDDPRRHFPYAITLEDIAKVYGNQGLRDEIRGKIQITLDLDPRYNFLALLIAFHSWAQQEILSRGLSLDEIRNAALQEWPQGFGRSSRSDAFFALLEEMVDLGLLRRVGDARYALRNPNVLQLLGNTDEVLRRLIEAQQKDFQDDDPRQQRRRLDETSPAMLSPLTAEQEALLFEENNRVIILFGHAISGLNLVEKALQAAEGTLRRRYIKWFRSLDMNQRNASELEELAKAIVEKARGDRRDGTIMLVFDATSGWNRSWVQAFRTVLGRMTGTRLFFRVLFLADPDRARDWMLADPDGSPTPEAITSLSLDPWSPQTLKQWCDLNATPATALSPGLDPLRVTGGWSPVFADLLKRSEQSNAPISNMVRALPDDLDLDTLVAAYGLAAEEPVMVRVLELIGDLGDEAVLSNELHVYLELDQASVARVVAWAKRLAWLHEEPQGLRRDPLLASWWTRRNRASS